MSFWGFIVMLIGISTGNGLLVAIGLIIIIWN